VTMQPEDEEHMLREVAAWAERYRDSRGRFEQSLLLAYDAGVGPTAIAKAVGHLSEGGVRMLVKRRKGPDRPADTDLNDHLNQTPKATR
jgi:hypothetical protein